jgi:hypothetical protein
MSRQNRTPASDILRRMYIYPNFSDESALGAFQVLEETLKEAGFTSEEIDGMSLREADRVVQEIEEDR